MTDAIAHFSRRLALETDAADVADALAAGAPPVLVDARSPEAFAAAHLPGALNLPRPLAADSLPAGDIVVYCWGPGCNGATKAALEVARLGRPVREMLGGFEYWVREGHPVEGAAAASLEPDHSGLVGLRGAVTCLC